jgi:hypothetical protein
MSASKERPHWGELPCRVRRQIEELAGGRVVRARSCEGGYSPGFASRLALHSGRRVFVKAMDADEWPFQAWFHRDEAAVASALPAEIPAPRFLGWSDDGHWVVLAFECVDGAEPAKPWRPDELARVVAGVSALTAATTPSPVAVPADHPRLGGWAEVASDRALRARLPAVSDWAAGHLDLLAALEAEGLAAARGNSLVHFDVFPHNILLTADRVLFVDWPHARLGASCIDLLSVLTSAAADGLDPEPFVPAQLDRRAVTGVLAAMAGSWLGAVVKGVQPGLEPIAAAKLHFGRGALGWAQRRLTSTGW